MKLNYDDPDQDVRIELVPLIDVIFCILTFFILAAVTLTRQTAINVDLPRASTGSTQLRELLIVSVDPIGQTYIEKQPVTRDQLYEAMLNFRQTSPDGLIVLYASRASSYNDVVSVLDLLRSVGGDRVALATLPGSGRNEQQFQLPDLPATEPIPFDPSQLPGAPDSLGDLDSLPGLEPLPGLSSPDPSAPGLSAPGLSVPGSPPTNLSPGSGSGNSQSDSSGLSPSGSGSSSSKSLTAPEL